MYFYIPHIFNRTELVNTLFIANKQLGINLTKDVYSLYSEKDHTY